MALIDLDHVNIRTNRLAEMTAFYSDVLGMAPGPRPPFGMGGAWLYCGDRAAVHIVEVDRAPNTGEPRIEHFAFRAKGLEAFKAALEAKGIDYRISMVPEWTITQVNIHDPDGNHIEVAFAPDERQ